MIVRPWDLIDTPVKGLIAVFAASLFEEGCSHPNLSVFLFQYRHHSYFREFKLVIFNLGLSNHVIAITNILLSFIVDALKYIFQYHSKR